ncbi:Thioredoxin-related transmembrane protein 2-like protein, partial [Fragariocoptes setiger]
DGKLKKKPVRTRKHRRGKKTHLGRARVGEPTSEQKIPAKQVLLFRKKAHKAKSMLDSPDGHIEIGEDATKRDSETMNQYLRRLDRLAAKARVDADIKSDLIKMPLVSKRELKELMHMHYLVEVTLACAFFILKLPYIERFVFDSDGYNTWETELLVFTAIAVAFRTRRRGHVNFLPYLSSACSMAKFGNFVLFFYAKPLYGLIYSMCILAHMLLLPKPRYKGPENVTYFVGEEFEKELAKNNGVDWLIEFYAGWNPDCNEFAGVFAELSARYSTKKLRFGKIDVSRCPKAAEKYHINTSVSTRELPTLILFSNGVETFRRPLTDARGRVVPFSFSYENIVATLDPERRSKAASKNATTETKKTR